MRRVGSPCRLILEELSLLWSLGYLASRCLLQLVLLRRPATTPVCLEAAGATVTLPLPDPRPRHHVHALLRRRLRQRGIMIVKTPLRAPKANAFAERFVDTVRRECLAWLLIVNQRHLERIFRVFVDHYKSHRPHRSLE